MEQQLRHLINLQEIDKEIGEITARVQEHPRLRGEIDREIQETRQRYEACRQQLEETKKARRGLEKEIEELDQRIRKSRTKLMEVKNNKEYKAMLTEIDELTKGKTAKEDSLLELMSQVEEQNLQVGRQKEALDTQMAEGAGRKVTLEQAGETALRELTRLEAHRRTIEELVDKPHLEKYEFLRERLKGPALAEARQGACRVCHMVLPPQMFNELQRHDRLIACPNCFRILYMGSLQGSPKEGDLP